MHPTTTGRFRVHDHRPRPIDGTPGDSPDETPETADDEPPESTDNGEAGAAEFVLVELPETPIDPSDPDAEGAYDPLYAAATGYEGELADRIDALEPGNVVDATLAWEDGDARITALDVVRETRFRFADDVEGMFEAAVEAWQRIRAEGEAIGSITTKSTDGDPNGALYLFADGPSTDTFAEVKTARLPIEPLIARVNETRGDDDPREVFVLRPAAHRFVAVYVVFERDGVLARTVRDTYGLGAGLAAGLDESGAAWEGGSMEGGPIEGGGADTGEDGGADTGEDGESDDDSFDITDRL